MAPFNDNLSRFLRMQNIFGVPPGEEELSPAVEAPQPEFAIPPMQEEEYDPGARMQELYTPETKMIEEYAAALEGMPERNKPGLLRKIFGGIAAFGRPGNTERVLYGPYERELEDWKERIDPLGRAANIERQNNANLRMMANQIVSQEMADARLQRQIRRDKTLEDQGWVRTAQGWKRIEQGDERVLQGWENVGQGAERVEQGWKRLAIEEIRAKGGQFEVDDQGNPFIVQKNGDTIHIDDMSYLSAEDKAEIEAKKAERVTAAREGAKRPRLAPSTAINPDTGEVDRGVINLEEGTYKPITRPEGVVAPPKPELEKGREVENRAQQYMVKFPEAKSWIKIHPDGRVEIDKPSSWMPGRPSVEEHRQMYKTIFKRDLPASSESPGIPNVNTPNAGNVTAPPKGQEGKVRVRRKLDGEMGWAFPNDPGLASGELERVQ